LILWVFVVGVFLTWSDVLLFEFMPNKGSALMVAIVEDLAFVIVSGAFLFLLVRRYTTSMALADYNRELASHALHTYLDSSPLAISIVDLQGFVVTWNPLAQKIFGWTEEEVRGKPDPSVTGDSSSDYQAQLQRIFKGERIDGAEQVRLAKDGAKVDVLLTSIPIRDAQGKTWGAVNVIEDVTERKLERAALIDTNRIFRSTFEDAAIGMAMAGLDGRWLKVNRALCGVLGYSEEELLAMTAQNVTYSEDLSITLDYNRQMVEGKTASYQIEKRYVRKDGKVIWVALSVSLVRDAKGQPLYSIEQLQDVTARKEAEDELKVYSVGLERMVKERTTQLEQAQGLLVQAERLAAIGSMAAQVAHDLRNPLTAINTNLYYIKTVIPERLGAKVDNSVKAIEEAVEHSSKIVDDLLEYSRAADLREERLNLSGLLTKCLEGCALPKSVKLNLELSDGIFTIGDPAKLTRVFQNIVVNAIEAMPEGGTLSVLSKAEADRAIVELVDTGVGMDEKTRQQLFNPFFTTKAKGLGLGLAICRRLVEAHGGEIEVESEVGKGTKVTVALPRARPPS
jgi:PAS domain S-box-containing protein